MPAIVFAFTLGPVALLHRCFIGLRALPIKLHLHLEISAHLLQKRSLGITLYRGALRVHTGFDGGLSVPF